MTTSTLLTFSLSSLSHTLDLNIVPSFPFLPNNQTLELWIPPVPIIQITDSPQKFPETPFSVNLTLVDEWRLPLSNYNITVTIVHSQLDLILNRSIYETLNNGQVRLSFIPEFAGPHVFIIYFVDLTGYYDTLNYTFSFTIDKFPSALTTMIDITPRYLYATTTLTINGTPFDNELIFWYLNDTLIAQGYTDDEGRSELQFLISQTGMYILRVQYDGRQNFEHMSEEIPISLVSTVIESTPLLQIGAFLSLSVPIVIMAVKKIRKPHGLDKIPIR